MYTKMVDPSGPAPADCWIVAYGHLCLTCPNGCCCHREGVTGGPMPAEWRPATMAEVEAGRDTVQWSIDAGQLLETMEIGGNA